MALETFLIVTSWGKSAAKHPVMHKTDPYSNNDLVQVLRLKNLGPKVQSDSMLACILSLSPRS